MSPFGVDSIPQVRVAGGFFHGKSHLEMDDTWGYPYDLGNHSMKEVFKFPQRTCSLVVNKQKQVKLVSLPWFYRVIEICMPEHVHFGAWISTRILVI